ncbi:MAG: ABC transporter ATP-binding protein [Chloroflexi bacterium]|nr:ABC transporter ATP-binding protein [Chloroflexota bacterium]
MTTATPLLEIRNATKVYGGGFLQSGSRVVALQNFSMTIPEKPAVITTIAGESGSGKTTLANAILGFINLTAGQIFYRGQDITTLTGQDATNYRREVQAVFQDPYEVYNPFYRVKHIYDMVIAHLDLGYTKSQAREVIEQSLRVVGLRGEEVLEKYPHQLSGGQRQRVMVARAYMMNPKLIIADEPVSAVDASLRAMILDVMLKLRDDLGVSFLYITHDLSTAYQIGDDIFVLYQGSIAERGRTVDVIERPHHPYVQMLINSVPVPDPAVKWGAVLEGVADESLRATVESGCRFYPRCPSRMDRCLQAMPPLYAVDGHEQQAACYLYHK